MAGLVLGGVIATGTTMGDRGVPALRSRAALPGAPIGVQLSVAPGHRGVALDPFEEALRRIEKLRGLAPRVEPWLVRRAEKLV